MSSQSRTVFVTAATGTQGTYVVKELLSTSESSSDSTTLTVHAFVRDPNSTASQNLLALDPRRVKLFQGDFDNVEALSRAAESCTSVFINVSPSLTDQEAEVRHAKNILSASLSASIKHVILSSTNGADQYTQFKNLDLESWLGRYFINKAAVINLVKSPPFSTPEGYTYTILQPAALLTNFLPSSLGFMYPALTSPTPTLRTAYTPVVHLPFLDPIDIGRFAARIVFTTTSSPAPAANIFTNKTIRLASTHLTISEVADALTHAVDKRKVVTVEYISPDDAKEMAKTNPYVASQLFQNENPKMVDLDEVRSYGVELGSVRGCFEREKHKVAAALGL